MLPGATRAAVTKIASGLMQRRVDRNNNGIHSALVDAADEAAAREWVESDDRSWPCSFHNICTAFDMDPARVRAGFAELRPVTADGCMRRGGYAALRV